jgi:hypothetical protein
MFTEYLCCVTNIILAINICTQRTYFARSHSRRQPEAFYKAIEAGAEPSTRIEVLTISRALQTIWTLFVSMMLVKLSLPAAQASSLGFFVFTVHFRTSSYSASRQEFSLTLHWTSLSAVIHCRRATVFDATKASIARISRSQVVGMKYLRTNCIESQALHLLNSLATLQWRCSCSFKD